MRPLLSVSLALHLMMAFLHSSSIFLELHIFLPLLSPGLLDLWFPFGPAAVRSLAAFGLQTLLGSLAGDRKDRERELSASVVMALGQHPVTLSQNPWLQHSLPPGAKPVNWGPHPNDTLENLTGIGKTEKFHHNFKVTL